MNTSRKVSSWEIREEIHYNSCSSVTQSQNEEPAVTQSLQDRRKRRKTAGDKLRLKCERFSKTVQSNKRGACNVTVWFQFSFSTWWCILTSRTVSSLVVLLWGNRLCGKPVRDHVRSDISELGFLISFWGEEDTNRKSCFCPPGVIVTLCVVSVSLTHLKQTLLHM